MRLAGFPFAATDWSRIEPTEHKADESKGGRGVAHWRTLTAGDTRVRVVEYSPGYVADHWCTKGHVVLCVAGELQTELKDGRTVTLRPGMSYQVADDAEPHRSSSETGARLFIVD